MKNKRIEWIDGAKGIGIILVVIGHACIPSLCATDKVINSIYLAINLFHMPVFFFLSGYTFYQFSKSNNFIQIIAKRFRRLIVPYILYICFVYLAVIIATNIEMFSVLLEKAGYRIPNNIILIIKDILFCYGLLDKHIWYIYALFFIQLISIMARHWKFNMLSVVMASVLISTILKVGGYEGILWSIMYYQQFFCLGKFDIFGFIDKQNKGIKLSIVILYVIFTVIYVRYIFFWQSFGVGFVLGKMLLGYAGVFAFFSLISCLSSLLKNRFIVITGKNSFAIYLLHQPFLVSGSVFIIYSIIKNELAAVLIGSIIGQVVPLLCALLHNCIRRKVYEWNNQKLSV